MLCYRDFILSSKKEVGCRVALLGNGKYSETEMSSQVKGFDDHRVRRLEEWKIMNWRLGFLNYWLKMKDLYLDI